MWAAAAGLIIKKGPGSIKVAWTKGHATDEDVSQGKCTEEQRHGNNIADTLAGSAHQLQPLHHASIRNLASARWKAAQRVVQATHLFLRDAILARSTQRKQLITRIQHNREQARTRQAHKRATDSPPDSGPANGDLWYPSPEQGHAIDDLSAHETRQPRTELQAAIHETIRRWKWHTPDEGKPKAGVSWLEMYVALLLDDNILTLLHADMSGRG